MPNDASASHAGQVNKNDPVASMDLKTDISEGPKNSSNVLMTSEAVPVGDLDKLCDLLADAGVDACLQQDKFCKVSIRVLIKARMVMLVGEVHSKACVEWDDLVRKVLKDVGYTDDEKCGLDYRTANVVVAITEHSPDVGQYMAMYGGTGPSGSTESNVSGSASTKTDKIVHPDNNAIKYPTQNFFTDSGLGVGYASKEMESGTNSTDLLPLSQLLATKFARQLTICRLSEKLPWLRPDGKVQVTVEYKNDGALIPERVHRVAITAPTHDVAVSLSQMRTDLKSLVIDPVVDGMPEGDQKDGFKRYFDEDTVYHLNYIAPSIVLAARYFVGATSSEGLSGQQTQVDFYGGHSGSIPSGGLCGKDPFKFERSASYAARWIAKSLVSSGICSRCEYQLLYSGAFEFPVSQSINTYGTSKHSNAELLNIIEKNFDLRIGALHGTLRLAEQKYSNYASFGFCSSAVNNDSGSNEDLPPWEVPLKIEI